MFTLFPSIHHPSITPQSVRSEAPRPQPLLHHRLMRIVSLVTVYSTAFVPVYVYAALAAIVVCRFYSVFALEHLAYGFILAISLSSNVFILFIKSCHCCNSTLLNTLGSSPSRTITFACVIVRIRSLLRLDIYSPSNSTPNANIARHAACAKCLSDSSPARCAYTCTNKWFK